MKLAADWRSHDFFPMCILVIGIIIVINSHRKSLATVRVCYFCIAWLLSCCCEASSHTVLLPPSLVRFRMTFSTLLATGIAEGVGFSWWTGFLLCLAFYVFAEVGAFLFSTPDTRTCTRHRWWISEKLSTCKLENSFIHFISDRKQKCNVWRGFSRVLHFREWQTIEMCAHHQRCMLVGAIHANMVQVHANQTWRGLRFELDIAGSNLINHRENKLHQ